MELDFLPTNASWLNWIESELTALRYRWRNARAQPKTDFAPNSVIRTWTGYQANVA
jgi:hypothetical protein